MAVVEEQVWLTQARPWFSLYGLRLKRRNSGDEACESDEEEEVSRLILMPRDILYHILFSCDPYTLGNAACACKHLLECVQHTELWRKACLDAWPQYGSAKIHELVQRHAYQGSWKSLWLKRPRLRCDGIYVSRNTYIKTGIVEWQVKNPVHLILYYRYIRFFPYGQFLYKTTPATISKVAKYLRTMPKGEPPVQGEDGVVKGRYHFHSDLVYTSMVYPGSRSTEIRSKLRLRSTTPARNNRLDILALMSYARDSDSYVPLDPGPGTEDENDAMPYSKGLNTYVFVPWHRVNSSELNLGIDQMDYFCTG